MCETGGERMPFAKRALPIGKGDIGIERSRARLLLSGRGRLNYFSRWPLVGSL